MSYKKYSKMLKKAGLGEDGTAEDLFLEIIDKANSIEEIERETRKKIEEISRQGAEPIIHSNGEPLDNSEIAMFLTENVNPERIAKFIDYDLSIKIRELSKALTQSDSPYDHALPFERELDHEYKPKNRPSIEYSFGEQFHHFMRQLKNLKLDKMWEVRSKILAQPEKFVEQLWEKAKKDLDNDL